MKKHSRAVRASCPDKPGVFIGFSAKCEPENPVFSPSGLLLAEGQTVGYVFVMKKHSQFVEVSYPNKLEVFIGSAKKVYRFVKPLSDQ